MMMYYGILREKGGEHPWNGVYLRGCVEEGEKESKFINILELATKLTNKT